MLRYEKRTKNLPGPDLPGFPRWFGEILKSRGVDTQEKAERFLNPSLDQLHDPLKMQDMDKALRIIRKAIADGENILIYGDYDVDGICAASILLETLREEGAAVTFRIPDRNGEGYGLNEAAVREIAGSHQLLITVDCGVTNHAEVALARELGMTVIVSDHHTPDDRRPPADAVLNPLLGDYPFRRLCGAGVALKICQGLQGLEGVRKRLDLAALATVADVVPLTDENRVIVSLGLERMAGGERPGIRALMAAASVTPPVRASHVAFRLAPRLNAGGRLETADQGVLLLTTRDATEAAALAERLENDNRERQRLESEIVREAEAMVVTDTDFRDDRVIVLMGDGWNKGLVGLAAGRIREKYHYPTIVLSRDGDVASGSCRSVPGVNIIQMLTACADLFIKFGGHDQAAGLTIRADLVGELKRRLNLRIRETCGEEVLIPVAEYDQRIPLKTVTLDTIALLERLEPTGCGNPEPTFACSADIREMRRVGRDGNHLKISLTEGGTVRDGIAFSMGDLADTGLRTADVLFTPEKNVYMGRVSEQLMVQAIRAAEGTVSLPDPSDALAAELRSLTALAELSAKPKKEDGTGVGPEIIPETRLRLMSGSGKGLLILAHTPETASRLALETGADLNVGSVRDPRGFDTVLLAPDPALLKDVWTTVVLADGDLLPGEAENIRQHCPRARLCALKPVPDRVKQIRGFDMSRLEMGALYRAAGRLTTGGPAALAKLREETGLDDLRILCGLSVFQELGLCRLRTCPFDARQEPQTEKKNLADSLLMVWMKKASATAGNVSA